LLPVVEYPGVAESKPGEKIMPKPTAAPRPYDYLFVPEVAALRRKLARATGVPALLWKSLRRLPNTTGNAVYGPAFCYLATGKEAYAEQALAGLREQMEVYLAGDISLDLQFHTWCNAAPMARLATMLDWIADSPAVSKRDFAAIKEAMLDYTLKHPYNIAKSRLRSFDNQIASMSFCCALVGYLFGVKRGNDLRAQRLMSAGMMRFPDIFGLTPPGGYSYEGSTYFCQIVTPVVSWYCALMEQITGEDLFHKPFPPNQTSPERILRTYLKIIGPSGLMPPWDNYGWMKCASLMGLAYLARKTGDPTPLKVIEAAGLALEPNHIAWGSDDRLWSLLWWPEDLPVGEAERVFPSWAVEDVAGALVEEKKRWRLFQAWDRCESGVYCGRAQVNPNMLALDLWGSTVFTDGSANPEKCTQFDYPPEVFNAVLGPGELESIANYLRSYSRWDPEKWVRGFSSGLVGASNSIVVNGEGFYSPAEPKEGRLVSFASLPNLKLLASEAAPFYQPRYPIESMVRTSLLVRDDYFLVSDAIHTSGESLRFDWQAFVRGKVTVRGRRVNIVTPEGVEVDILPLDKELKPRLTDVPGFPSDLEGCSTLIQYGAEGSEVTIPLLIVPHRQGRPVADLSEGWACVRQDCEAGLAEGLHRRVKGKRTRPLAEAGLLKSEDDADSWVWAGRELSLPAETEGQRIFLHLASVEYGLRVWVNGQEIPVFERREEGSRRPAWYVPVMVEITGAVQKKNTLVLGGCTVQGKLVNGTVELMVETEKPPLPTIRALGPDHYEIRGAWGRDEIILNPTGETISAKAVSGDARAVLLTETGFAALQATRLALGEMDFWSDRPLDVAWEPGLVALGDLSGPENVEIAHPDFRVSLESRGAIEIDLVGPCRPRIVTSVDHEKSVFCNGRLTDATRDPLTGRLEIDPALSLVTTKSDKAMPTYVKQMEALMRAASQPGEGAVAELIAALGDPNWKLQQVAAELLGRLGNPAAVGPLLEVLARETPEVIYADDTLTWSAAREKLRAEGPDRFRLGTGGADMTKRHRLKVAVIEALGRLRAREAVPALCGILEDQREFYPVHSQAARALGRIGDPAALPALEKAAGYAELNTKVRARDAIARLTTGRPLWPEYPDRSPA
jgi:hypothetical protein